MVTKEEIDMLCLQESKWENISDEVCCSIWGDKEVEWKIVPTINKASGVISLWRKGMFGALNIFIR